MLRRNCQTLFSAFLFISEVFVLTCPLTMCTWHSVRYREKEKIVPPRLTSGSTNLVQSRGKDRVKVEKRTEMDLKNTTERYN